MSPLQIFFQTVKILTIKPFSFWPATHQKKLLQDLQSAVSRLVGLLENKELQSSLAYRILIIVQGSISKTAIDEAVFIQYLDNLIDIYKQTPADGKMKNLLDELGTETKKAKLKILKYHISLESLNKKAKKMKEEEKIKSDQKIIQDVGIFYVLEYTLQVFFEFIHLSDSDKQKLLKKGLKTKAGNLPAYLLLEDSFRDDLCLRIFDSELRSKLLNAFYNFEEVLFTGNVKKIVPALKKFNLELLRDFKANGLSIFKAVVYAPFGNNMTIDLLIKKVEEIKV